MAETGKRKNQAIIYNNLGHLNVQMHRFDDALNHFQNACQIFDSLEDKHGKAEQLGNMGSVYRDKFESKKALELYFDAISIFEEIGDKLGFANQSANIGYIYAVDKKAEEALEWFKKALPLYEELRATKLADRTRQNIENLSNIY